MENLDEDEEVGPAGEAAGGRGSPCACRGGGWRKDCNSILSRGAAAVGLDSRRVKVEFSALFVGQLVSEVKSLFGVQGLVFFCGVSCETRESRPGDKRLHFWPDDGSRPVRAHFSRAQIDARALAARHGRDFPFVVACCELWPDSWTTVRAQSNRAQIDARALALVRLSVCGGRSLSLVCPCRSRRRKARRLEAL